MKVMYFFYVRRKSLCLFYFIFLNIEPCQYKNITLPQTAILCYALTFLIHGLAHKSL